MTRLGLEYGHCGLLCTTQVRACPDSPVARVGCARALEIQLNGAIKDSNGGIFSEAQETLRRLPRDVY